MSVKDLTKLHPILLNRIEELRKQCDKHGLRIGFSDAVRNREEQNRLYAQGRTTPGSIVTYVQYPNSQHNWGIAVDFFIFVKDKNGKDVASYEINTMNQVGMIAQNIGLGWGGNWRPIDRPHLYLPNWGSTPGLLIREFGSPDKFFASWSEKETQSNVVVPKENIKPTVPILRIGATGDDVKALQANLNRHGAKLKVDGVFGQLTDRAVRDFQSRRGLVVDGSVGALTQAELRKEPSLFFPKGTGLGFVDALNSIKVDSSFANRRRIANANGIPFYTGSARHNTTLRDLLITGKLKRP